MEIWQSFNAKFRKKRGKFGRRERKKASMPSREKEIWHNFNAKEKEREIQQNFNTKERVRGI